MRWNDLKTGLNTCPQKTFKIFFGQIQYRQIFALQHGAFFPKASANAPFLCGCYASTLCTATVQNTPLLYFRWPANLLSTGQSSCFQVGYSKFRATISMQIAAIYAGLTTDLEEFFELHCSKLSVYWIRPIQADVTTVKFLTKQSGCIGSNTNGA